MWQSWSQCRGMWSRYDAGMLVPLIDDRRMTRSRAKELQEDLAGLVRHYKVLRDLSPPPMKTSVMLQVLLK